MQVPLDLLASSVAVALFPTISRCSSKKSRRTAHNFDAAFARIIGAMLFATVMTIVLAPALVSLVFQSGKFRATDASDTALALQCYALCLPALGAQQLLARGFFATDRAREPVGIGLFAMGLFLVLGFGATQFYLGGGASLALAAAISTSVLSGLLWRSLRKHLNLDNRAAFARNWARSVGGNWRGRGGVSGDVGGATLRRALRERKRIERAQVRGARDYRGGGRRRGRGILAVGSAHEQAEGALIGFRRIRALNLIKLRVMAITRGEKKLAVICALALAVPLGVAAFIGHINATPQIAATAPVVPPNPNGYDLYVQASNSIKEAKPSVDAILDLKPPTDPKLRAQRYNWKRKDVWLAQNKAGFALFKKAQQAQSLAPPYGAKSQGREIRQMARYKVIESNAHWQRGDFNAALQSGLDILQMGYDSRRSGNQWDWMDWQRDVRSDARDDGRYHRTFERPTGARGRAARGAIARHSLDFGAIPGRRKSARETGLAGLLRYARLARRFHARTR